MTNRPSGSAQARRWSAWNKDARQPLLRQNVSPALAQVGQRPGARGERVVTEVIAPVLANDGGKLEILGLDEAEGSLRIRFVGSCANCPYSLLSMEQLVRPTLLQIPGIREVHHRAKMRKSELAGGGVGERESV